MVDMCSYAQLARLLLFLWSILYHHRESFWETDEEDGFQIVDLPDVVVSVSQYRDFTSLQPGEIWSINVIRVDGHESLSSEILPDNVMVSDVFRYVFEGVVVD